MQHVELDRSAARAGGHNPFDPPAKLARSRGAADVRFKLRDSATVFDTLYQSGCLRIRMPMPEPRCIPEAIIINTSGGLTGGDETSVNVHWQRGTSALLCTQAAEKIYRSSGDQVRVAQHLTVDEGAEAEWLPQETILFDQAQLHRTCEVDIAPGGRFLGLESLVFGRAAMGETVNYAELCDGWKIRCGGKLIYADVFRIGGSVSRLLNHSAIAAGARAFATLLLVAAGSLAALAGQIRDAFAHALGRAAVSHWNGMLAVRFLAPDSAILKHDVTLALAVVRGGRALPRAWRC